MNASDMKKLIKFLLDKDREADRLSDKYEALGIYIERATEAVFTTAYDTFSLICDMTGNDGDDIKDDFIEYSFSEFWKRWGEALTDGCQVDKDSH